MIGYHCVCVETARIVSIGLLVMYVGCGEAEDSEPAEAVVIGNSTVEIDTRLITTRVGEAAIGNFMADVLLDSLWDRGYMVDFALINAGAIRGGEWDLSSFSPRNDEAFLGQVYPAGELTDLQVDGWLPFRNDHTVARLTGGQLLSILERSVQHLPASLAENQGGWLLQTSDGLAYEARCDGVPQLLDSAGTGIAQEGQRIAKIVLGGRVVYDVADGIDELADLSVLMGVNSFIAGGNDGHIAFNEAEEVANLAFEDFNHIDEIKQYIQDNSPIAPSLSSRITIVGGCDVPVSLP